tara:strand:+ start:14623 stop:14940 length:318 start_codon:yes stop_codon:yes gene_type:complete
MDPKLYSKDNYFQSILQLRPNNQEVLDFVEKQLINNNIKIGKEVKRKEGVDLYLSNKNFTVSLGKKLKRRFQGELKLSKSIFTKSRITSKDVYRVTILFRLSKPL